MFIEHLLYAGSLWLTGIALLIVPTPCWGIFNCYALFMDGEIKA